MFGALAYNQNKVDNEDAKVLFSNRMLLNEDGNFSIGECMHSFEMQMPVQLSTKKPIVHISINPHPEDVLSDQQLTDIAQEYMQKLGYGNQPYLVYKHEDIDRHHIHIVGLRVDKHCKSIPGKPCIGYARFGKIVCRGKLVHKTANRKRLCTLSL